MITCPECGLPAEMHHNICEHCGIKVKICPECGNAVDETLAVCNFCGVSLAEPTINAEQAAEEAAKKAAEEQEQLLEKLKEQENKLALYAEKASKPFSVISSILSGIGVIPFLIAMVLCISFIPSQNGPSPTAAGMAGKQLIINLLLGGFSFFLIVSSCVKELTPLFTARKIRNKIEKEQFDYVTYYKNLKVYKRDKGTRLIEAEMRDKKANAIYCNHASSILLIQALMYKDNPSAVAMKIIKAVLATFINILMCIFAILGFNVIISSWINAILYSRLVSTEFNSFFKIAIVLFVVEIAVNIIFDRTYKNVTDWVYDIKESK